MRTTNRALAISVALSLSVIYPSSPAFAATDDDCELDEIMVTNRKVMDEMAQGVFESQVTNQIEKAIDSAPHVKNGACLPILDTLDTLIRMKIPSLGSLTGQLLTKIRDMACNMANGFLENIASQAEFNVSDPLGVASIGIGASTDGSGGVQKETYDITEVVSEAVEQAVVDKVQAYSSEADGAIKNLPIGNSNRTQPDVATEIGNAVNDAVKGL